MENRRLPRELKKEREVGWEGGVPTLRCDGLPPSWPATSSEIDGRIK